MGKFILSELRKKTGRFLSDRKESITSKALAGSVFTLEHQYKLFFWCLNGYIKGKPNKKHRLVWKSVIEHVIDSESMCDDFPFKNMKVLERVKLIGKQRVVEDVHRAWIERELKPYFEISMRNQIVNMSDALFNDIKSGVISPDEAKNAYDIYSKDKGRFK